MSFSSRRRNYLLTPHRRDGLIEWMKSMLQHSFVLDALETTAADTFSHFELLIDEHIQWTTNSSRHEDTHTLCPEENCTRIPTEPTNDASTSSFGTLPKMRMNRSSNTRVSRLKQLVPTVGTFHTRLPLRRAFLAYNVKYAITKRRHVCISFNELRHILNLAQIMALHGGNWNDEIHTSSKVNGYEEDPDSEVDAEDEQHISNHSHSSPANSLDTDTMGNSLARNIWNPTSRKMERKSVSFLNEPLLRKEEEQAFWRLCNSPSIFSSLPPNNTLGPPPLSLSSSPPTSYEHPPKSLIHGKTITIQNRSLTNPTSFLAPSIMQPKDSTPDHHEGDPHANTQTFLGPTMITFDGDQTLYADGANFESNPKLAFYIYLLLRHGVTVAVVTAAGYEYQVDKYEIRLSGLLTYFRERSLPAVCCERFYLFGGECNYLLQLGFDYKLHPVEEYGIGGWLTSTKHIPESPANWTESDIQRLLNVAEFNMKQSVTEQNIRGRIIRKKRSVGLIPDHEEIIPREALDETVLRVQSILQGYVDNCNARENDNVAQNLPYCAFNGGKDAWVDVGNKRVGVTILSSYLGIPPNQMLHIGDQFLNTGNDVAARDVCPCVWIINPEETTYILKSILRLADVSLCDETRHGHHHPSTTMNVSLFSSLRLEKNVATKGANVAMNKGIDCTVNSTAIDFNMMAMRQTGSTSVGMMDVYTGEMIRTG